MKVLRSRRLAGLAGCAVLALSVAGTAAAGPAQAQARDQVRAAAAVAPPPDVASWGLNNAGQLGDGTTTDRPRFVDVRAGTSVVQVAAGWALQFGHGLEARSDGTAWAWGGNGFGELGDGTTDSRLSPVQVTGLTGVTQVAGGCIHSLALRSDGTVWAWGGNRFGELGRGTVTDHEVTPAPVAGLAGVVKIAAGCEYSLAVRSDGTVWAWGANPVGELGTGGTASSAVPVQVTGVSRVTAIAAGWNSAVAVVAGGASVWTWGDNESGQLGDGTLVTRTTPVRVTQLGTTHIAGAAAGGGGRIGAFTAILGTDGSVWAWGADNTGQLGNARTDTPATRPVNTIRAGSGITQIAAGANHMVALKSDGTVLAWGDNSAGELGTGSTTPVTGPVQVTGLTSATQVAAGIGSGFAVHVPVPPAIVPDLTGDSQTRAAQVLQAAGLVLGAVTAVTDKFCDNLGVRTQDPPAGTAVNPGSAVSVTIGQPPPGGCP
jgi:alpha-tubulin suppressor-like RCC1 family protein